MQLLYKLLFIILIISYATYSIELSFVVSLIAIPFALRSNLNKIIFYSLIFLLLIFLIGFIRSFFLDASLFSKIKDYVYFTRPVLILLATYLVTVKIKSYYFVLNVIVFIASIIAAYHLVMIIINLNSLANYTSLRMVAGKQNHIEVVALVIMTFTNYFSKKNNLKKNIKIIFYVILSVSVFLYFSRSMFVVFLIFFLSYKGYLFLSKKLIRGSLIIGILVFTSFLLLKNLDFKKNVTHTSNFTYKIYNSINELFGSVNLSKIKKDKNELWEQWRAYESSVAIDNILTSDNKYINFIFGMGFGSDINLKTDVKLEGQIYKSVPSIHNGYVNILYKTGILGFILYISFIVFSYLYGNYHTFVKEYQKSLFIGSLFYIIYNSFVIAGFLRPGEFSLVIFAISLALNRNLYCNEKQICRQRFDVY